MDPERAPSPASPRSLPRRLDGAVYAAEKTFVVVSMAVMVLTVFVDVVARRLKAPESKLAATLYALGSPLGLTPEGAPWVDATLTPLVGAALVIGLLWFGLATVRRRGAGGVPASLEPLLALGGAAVLYGLGWVMLHRSSSELYSLLCLAAGLAYGVGRLARRPDRARQTSPTTRSPGTVITWGVILLLGAAALRHVPEGYSWAKEVAMILLVWTGLVGASMASHEGRHIGIEFGRKVFPARMRRGVTLFAHGLTLAFCLLLVILGGQYVFGPAGLYRLQGRFPHTGIPDWLVAIAIPYTFLSIALRTTLVIGRVARGELEAKGSARDAASSEAGAQGKAASVAAATAAVEGER